MCATCIGSSTDRQDLQTLRYIGGVPSHNRLVSGHGRQDSVHDDCRTPTRTHQRRRFLIISGGHQRVRKHVPPREYAYLQNVSFLFL